MPQQMKQGDAPAQHQIDWDDLRLFLHCSRHRSFRAAAEAVGLTSATLMRRIDRLEDELGFKVFLRERNGIILSDEGKDLLGEVREMERISFNVARRAARENNDLSGIVRVAVTEGPGIFWILPRLIDFQKVYRRVTVDLQCAMQQADVVRLETDISIQLSPPTAQDLIVTKLARLHIHPFVSREYFELHGVPKSQDELSQHRYVSQNAPAIDELAFARLGGIQSLDGIISVRTNSSTAVLYAVERGAGIGFLPTSSVALGATLVPVDYGPRYHVDLWLTYHSTFKSSERHRVVIAWLRRIFDPKTNPCFRDEFIHPNELVDLMKAERESYGLEGYRAAMPE